MNNSIHDSVTDRLDVRVLIAVLFVSVLEFELFTFSRAIVEVAGQDAWLSILFGGVIVSVNTILLVKLMARFPRENIFQFSGRVWGKPLSLVVIAGYLLYWLVFLTALLEDFSVANQTFFVREAPPILSVILLVIGAAWVVSYGFTAVVRLLQMMLPFILLPLIFIATISAPHIRLENFQPILAGGIMPVFKGAILFAGFLQGLEVILFAGPFLENPKKALKPALIGVNLLLLFPFLQAFNAIGILGVDYINVSVWPGIDTMSAIHFPGFPVERFELFLTLPWLVAIFTTLSVFLYLLSFGVVQTLNMKHRKVIIYLLAGVVAAATYLFPNYAWAMAVREKLNTATLLFISVIPVITLILAVIRKKEGTEVD